MSEGVLPVPGRDPSDGEGLRPGQSAAKLNPSSGAPGERRRRRRAMISAPIRVRTSQLTGDGPDDISTTIDVSRAGILFLTASVGYARGMKVKVIFPYSKAPEVLQAEQDGCVARVAEMPGGRHAVAIVLGTEGVGEDLVDAAGRKLNVSSDDHGNQASEEHKPLVVVVDEDVATLESLKGYLTNNGYEVIAVNNASDGREVLNLFTPALVIAEIQGENLPGYAICEYVKETPRLRTVPVVLTTMSGNPSDYSGAHSIGAVVCMAKPYRQQRIGHIVRLLAPSSRMGR
jgi:CheY-like chemotaxis protein